MYWIQIINGYVTAIGTGKGNEEITEQRYHEILTMIRSRPTASEGFDYRLTKTLEWELYELPVEEEKELSAEEALDIILGGEV